VLSEDILTGLSLAVITAGGGGRYAQVVEAHNWQQHGSRLDGQRLFGHGQRKRIRRWVAFKAAQRKPRSARIRILQDLACEEGAPGPHDQGGSSQISARLRSRIVRWRRVGRGGGEGAGRAAPTCWGCRCADAVVVSPWGPSASSMQRAMYRRRLMRRPAWLVDAAHFTDERRLVGLGSKVGGLGRVI